MAEYIRIGEPANEAERKGFRLLRDHLPDHYVVLGNFDLRLPQRRTSLEYDAVVIGEYGFFAVEIKGWSGLIRGGARHWTLPWGRRSNPLNHLDKKTKALAHFVRSRVDGLAEECFFSPVLLFPRSGVHFELPERHMDVIVGPDGVYNHFVDLELVRQKGPGPFRSRQKAQEVVDAIVSLSEPTEQGVFLPYYDVEGERELPDRAYREYVGTHQYLQGRSKVRIKAYTMDSLAESSQLRQEQNRVLRDMEALEVLNDNPYVARSYEMQPDYKDELIFYLVSEWVGPKTLRDYIDERDGLGPRCVEFAHHLIEAVISIHESGIVHRNLNPEVIYPTVDDSSVPLKVADFDFARVSKLESIAEALSHIGTNGYKAPELWLDQDYDHRVDVFSLGTILYELLTSRMLFGGPGQLLRPEAVWDERGKAIDDPGLRQAIGGMVSKDPARRIPALTKARRYFAKWCKEQMSVAGE